MTIIRRNGSGQATAFNEYTFLHPSISNVRSGDLVRHAKFGEGVVVEMLGSGSDYEVMGSFREEGVKRLLLSYAQLEKLE